MNFSKQDARTGLLATRAASSSARQPRISTVEDPFRIEFGPPEQLVLRFDDISIPMDGYIEPNEVDIKRALSFADKIGDGPLLVHCHAGISRSSAIALAIIAERLGPGKERETVQFVERINPICCDSAFLSAPKHYGRNPIALVSPVLLVLHCRPMKWA
jgi:hypothetical protein